MGVGLTKTRAQAWARARARAHHPTTLPPHTNSHPHPRTHPHTPPLQVHRGQRLCRVGDEQGVHLQGAPLRRRHWRGAGARGGCARRGRFSGRAGAGRWGALRGAPGCCFVCARVRVCARARGHARACFSDRAVQRRGRGARMRARSRRTHAGHCTPTQRGAARSTGGGGCGRLGAGRVHATRHAAMPGRRRSLCALTPLPRPPPPPLPPHAAPPPPPAAAAALRLASTCSRKSSPAL